MSPTNQATVNLLLKEALHVNCGQPDSASQS